MRGLETTATFDKETDEFVIHSPTLTSLKWYGSSPNDHLNHPLTREWYRWPTGMYACTHAVVLAQLIIDGHNYGFHGFMVQVYSRAFPQNWP